MNMIRETVKQFQQHHNYGKEWASGMMQYCSSSVEKYVFSKLYATIFAMYLFNSSSQDQIIRDKIAACPHTGQALMQRLEMKSQYMAVSEDRTGYESAVECVNKVERTAYPSEKMGYVVQMYSEMKTAVIDCSKGKYELVSMDDQMAVFIYVMMKCSLKNPITEINLLFDYIAYKENGNDMEQLLITNLQVIFKITTIVQSHVHTKRLRSNGQLIYIKTLNINSYPHLP
eukprot:TRINITY_DN4473_c0_g1_i11.p1 TRINITY_DN4473_c0_g1~~TRINITY_DN4473_c0_g1_i11.p1  ORF type:complete len:229 (-),score=36.88 TRINITY_DN4473_c0_g1_i11:32-718(-)